MSRHCKYFRSDEFLEGIIVKMRDESKTIFYFQCDLPVDFSDGQVVCPCLADFLNFFSKNVGSRSLFLNIE